MPSALISGHRAAGRPTSTPPTRPDTVGDLCLGLELKFLLLGLPLTECGGEDSWPSAEGEVMYGKTEAFFQEQAYAAVARVLGGRAAAACVSSKRGFESRKSVAADIAIAAISRTAVAAAGRAERDYWSSHWIVKKANSVEHTADDPLPDQRRTNGVAVPVELSSPKLAWVDDDHSPRVRSAVSRRRPLQQQQRQVHAVVARLRAALPVVANYTCDLHVHMGRQDGVAFALPTLKMLATICWLAEPVLRSVRDPRSPNFQNVYTWGFEQRRYSRLGLALAKERETAVATAPATTARDGITIGEDLLRRVRNATNEAGVDGTPASDDWHDCMGGTGAATNEAVRAIWLAASSVELGQLLSGPQREHRRLGFNFSAFGGEDERARTNPRTIEFRFLEGTLAPERILGWLRICGQLAALAMQGRRRPFQRVVRYLLAQQRVYDALREHRDVLGSVGVPPHPPRDMLFAELMERIGVQAATYGPFQEKIRREYRCT